MSDEPIHTFMMYGGYRGFYNYGGTSGYSYYAATDNPIYGLPTEGDSIPIYLQVWVDGSPSSGYFEYWFVDRTAETGDDFSSSCTATSKCGIYVYGSDTVYISTLTDSLNETTESFEIHVQLQSVNGSESVFEADIADDDGPSLLSAVDYTYDPFNQLVKRTYDADGDGSGTAVSTFYSHEGGQIALQFDSATATYPSHRFFWNPAAVDQLLADETVTSSSAGTIKWPLADQVGTIRDIASHNSSTHATTIDNHRYYDSFGNLVDESNTAVDMLFGYTGRLWDEASQLQNNLNRWYDPKAGRWISEDPVGFFGGDSNLSRYVGNSPVVATDPLGLAEHAVKCKGTVVIGNAGDTLGGFPTSSHLSLYAEYLAAHGYNVLQIDLYGDDLNSLIMKGLPADTVGIILSGHGDAQQIGQMLVAVLGDKISRLIKAGGYIRLSRA